MRGHEPLYGNILVPVTEDVAALALPHAFSLARSTGGRLVFCHVTGTEGPPPGFLTELQERADAAGLEARIEYPAGDRGLEILKLAHHLPADLVILVGRPGSEVVEHLVNELCHAADPMAAPCPVMVVPNPLGRPREQETVPPTRRVTY